MKRSFVREFRSTLRRFERLIAGRLKESSCCSGVTLPQCHALLEIEARGRVSLIELVQSLGLDKSTLSRTADGLVNNGLISRTFSDLDRRSIQIALSPQGQGICDQINLSNDQFFSRVLGRIPAAKRQQVMDAFQELVNALAMETDWTGDEGCRPANRKKERKSKENDGLD
jgi:DNA-binding MarR family transcriptional regulator